jgi:hypothetical protein
MRSATFRFQSASDLGDAVSWLLADGGPEVEALLAWLPGEVLEVPVCTGAGGVVHPRASKTATPMPIALRVERAWLIEHSLANHRHPGRVLARL